MKNPATDSRGGAPTPRALGFSARALNQGRRNGTPTGRKHRATATWGAAIALQKSLRILWKASVERAYCSRFLPPGAAGVRRSRGERRVETSAQSCERCQPKTNPARYPSVRFARARGAEALKLFKGNSRASWPRALALIRAPVRRRARQPKYLAKRGQACVQAPAKSSGAHGAAAARLTLLSVNFHACAWPRRSPARERAPTTHTRCKSRQNCVARCSRGVSFPSSQKAIRRTRRRGAGRAQRCDREADFGLGLNCGSRPSSISLIANVVPREGVSAGHARRGRKFRPPSC